MGHTVRPPSASLTRFHETTLVISALMHWIPAFRGQSVGALRIGASVVVVLLWMASRRRGAWSPGDPREWRRSLSLLAAAGLFWTGVTECWTVFSRLYALSVLGLSVGFLFHSLLVLGVASEGQWTRWGVLRPGLVLVGVLTGLLGIELFCQWRFPGSFYDVVPDDARMGEMIAEAKSYRFTLQPGFVGRTIHPEFPGRRVSINAWGLRDDDRAAESPRAEELSILVLGDSLTFGTGVEDHETYSALLEESLTASMSRSVRVYGAGVPGLGQKDCRLRLAEYAERTQPDLVIAALYEGNDFDEDLRHEHFLRRRAEAVEQSNSPPNSTEETARKEDSGEKEEREPPPPIPGSDQLLRVSLERLGKVNFWFGSSACLQYLRPTLEESLAERGVLKRFVPVNNFLTKALLTTPPPGVHEAVYASIQALRGIAADCEALGARLIVLVIPAAVQASPEIFDRFASTRGRKYRGKKFDRTLLHNTLVTVLRADHEVVVDPLPLLEKEFVAGNPGYYREGHFNATGHRWMADLLRTEVQQLLTQPPAKH